MMCGLIGWYDTGSCLIACWLQPFDDITPDDISQQLDNIAQQVARELLKPHPTSQSDGRESSGDSQGEVAVVSQSPALLSTALEMHFPRDVILQAINTVLYDQLGFAPASVGDYYKLENSLINKVEAARIFGMPLTDYLIRCSL